MGALAVVSVGVCLIKLQVSSYWSGRPGGVVRVGGTVFRKISSFQLAPSMVVRNFTTDQNKLIIAEISYYDQEKNATEKYILEAIRANETPSQVSENNPTVPSLHCDDAADPEPSADDKYFPALFPTFISQAATNHYDKMSTPFSVSFGTNEKTIIYEDAESEPLDYFSKNQSLS